MTASRDVEPTRALGISMLCEKRAAHIATSANYAIQRNDAMEVGYRYFQCRSGSNTSLAEFALATFLTALTLKDIYQTGSYSMLPNAAFFIANIFPNFANHKRYSSIEKNCETWLKQRFTDQEFKQIEKFRYNKKGLDSFTLFLRNKGIDATEKKLADIEVIQHALLSMTLAYFLPGVAILCIGYEILRILSDKLLFEQRPTGSQNRPG